MTGSLATAEGPTPQDTLRAQPASSDTSPMPGNLTPEQQDAYRAFSGSGEELARRIGVSPAGVKPMSFSRAQQTGAASSPPPAGDVTGALAAAAEGRKGALLSGPQRPHFRPVPGGLTASGSAAVSDRRATAGAKFAGDSAEAQAKAYEVDYNLVKDSFEIARTATDDNLKMQGITAIHSTAEKYGIPLTGNVDSDEKIVTEWLSAKQKQLFEDVQREKAQKSLDAMIENHRFEDFDPRTEEAQPVMGGIAAMASKAKRDADFQRRDMLSRMDRAEIEHLTPADGIAHLNKKYDDEKDNAYVLEMHRQFGTPLGLSKQGVDSMLAQQNSQKANRRAEESLGVSKAGLDIRVAEIKRAADSHQEDAFRTGLEGLRNEVERLKDRQASAEADEKGSGKAYDQPIEDAEILFTNATTQFSVEFPESRYNGLLGTGAGNASPGFGAALDADLGAGRGPAGSGGDTKPRVTAGSRVPDRTKFRRSPPSTEELMDWHYDRAAKGWVPNDPVPPLSAEDQAAIDALQKTPAPAHPFSLRGM